MLFVPVVDLMHLNKIGNFGLFDNELNITSIQIYDTPLLEVICQVYFRVCPFQGMCRGRLHVAPVWDQYTCWIFYFPWLRHRIEGTNGLQSLIQKTVNVG